MINRLPILSGASVGLLVLLAACIASNAEELRRSGQELIDDAAQQLYQGPPLEASVECTVRLFELELIGTGSYLQFGGSTGKTRLVLAFAAGGKVIRKRTQITDGRHYLYERVENRGVESLVSVDLRKVSRAMADADSDQTPAPPLELSAVGGVPRLLTQLSLNFEFGTPIKSHLGDAPDKIPVWIIPGRWKRENLARLLPKHHKQILAGKLAPLEQLKAHLPHEVEVTLGNDDKFPLFPYKVVYLRHAPEGAEKSKTRSDNMIEILSLKLFEVKQRPLLRRDEFDYKPQRNQDDVSKTTDGTADYIKRLGLKPATSKDE
jgi:hypothetical protein